MKLDIQQAIIELNQIAQGGIHHARNKGQHDVIDSCDGRLKEALHVFDPNLREPLMFILNNAAKLVEALHQVPAPAKLSNAAQAMLSFVPPPLSPEQEEHLNATLDTIFGDGTEGDLDLPETAYTNFPLVNAPHELAMFEKIAQGYLGDYDYIPSLEKDEHGRFIDPHVRSAWMGWQKRSLVASKRPLDQLVHFHRLVEEDNPYAYFELAYSRSTGWMAWVCSNVITRDKTRKVLACGSGATPDQACVNAVRSSKRD